MAAEERLRVYASLRRGYPHEHERKDIEDPECPMRVVVLGAAGNVGTSVLRSLARRWTDEMLPLLADDNDPLGTEDLKTRTMALSEAPRGYGIFQKKQDGAIKIVLKP